MFRRFLLAGAFLASFAVVPFAFAEISSTVDRSNDLLTRRDALQMTFDAREDWSDRVQWFRDHLSYLPLYIDVQREDSAAPYVEVAFEKNLMVGFSDRTFRPDDSVAVEDAIALVLRVYGQDVEQDENQWYAPYIRLALSRHLIADPHSMSLGQQITRGQFADILDRMDVVTRENIEAFTEPQVAPVGTAPIVSTAQEGTWDPSSASTFTVAKASDDQSETNAYQSQQDFSITIPSLGITNLTITHPEDSLSQEGLLKVLQDGVGHLFSYPGRGGKIMVYGHSSGYSWDVSKYTKIFREVHRLQAGDKVYITFQGHLYVYSVTGQQVISAGDNRPFTGDGEELLLYTCWPMNSNKQRLIVRAVPVETVAVK